jgi:hypothetical protein
MGALIIMKRPVKPILGAIFIIVIVFAVLNARGIDLSF